LRHEDAHWAGKVRVAGKNMHVAGENMHVDGKNMHLDGRIF
jgi:hypothetical protein